MKGLFTYFSFVCISDSPHIIVGLDECFARVIHQEGHRMEVDALSGSEKTAVATAYRLALNEFIKRLVDMDDSLLILDEPTDGFQGTDASAQICVR